MPKVKSYILLTLVLISSTAVGYVAIQKVPKPTETEKVLVTISEGLRKEQIVFILADRLNWTDEQIEKFIEEDTAPARTLVEGYTAPGQYEIPIDSSTHDVATIMRRAANRLYEPYKNTIGISNWYQTLIVASIVQREMDSTGSDRFIIAEHIWQKLDANRPIESPATTQWARDTMHVYGESWCEGHEEQSPNCATVWSLQFHVAVARDYGWWQTIDNNYIDWDDFDTFQHVGLPPRPISNPGLDAIEAAVMTRYAPNGEVLSEY